jgi:hypothetical protein
MDIAVWYSTVISKDKRVFLAHEYNLVLSDTFNNIQNN